EFPYPGTHLDESGEVESLKADLRLAGVVEPWIGVKLHTDALVERRKAFDALSAFEERGCAGDEQVHPGVAPGVQLVDPLSQCVEGFLPDVAAHALQGFDLVQDEQKAAVAGPAQNLEQPL